MNRNEAILELLPLVERLAARMARKLARSVDVEDLVQAGAIAVGRAAETFDAGRGVAFVTFAWRRINGAMIEEVERNAAESCGVLMDDLEALADTAGDAEWWANITNELSRTEALIIRLRYWEAMSFPEIGRAAGFCGSTCRKTHDLVIARLRSRLRPEPAAQ